MGIEDGLFQITKDGIDTMFTEEFWKKSRFQQCMLLILYAAFIAEKGSFSFESVKHIIHKKKLASKTNDEFKKICEELKENKESCEDFLNLEFN